MELPSLKKLKLIQTMPAAIRLATEMVAPTNGEEASTLPSYTRSMRQLRPPPIAIKTTTQEEEEIMDSSSCLHL